MRRPACPATACPVDAAAMLARLASIDTWIFDLDNTLYPARANLFARIDARMTAYVARRLGVGPTEALRIQKAYFHQHGTTLTGLMAEHGVDPHDFLADVHDVEMDVLEQDAPLAAAIARLPGRKLVFTNGDKPYALKVLDRLGLGESFEAIHDIHAMDLVPKPHPSAYAGLCAAFGIDPTRALFAEDMARNLVPAKAIGMTTVWVDNGSEQGPEAARDHIDYTVHDLTSWLTHVTEAL
jgi:putative hydrolase of the HAD superfamily